MKKKSLAVLGALSFLFIVLAVRAEDATVLTPTPKGKFGEAVRELREQNREERIKVFEGNQETRKQLREENKEEREDVREENKEERQTFREDTKKLLEGKTPEEKLTLMPTIQAGRKTLNVQNRTQMQTLKKAQWDSKKTVTENIRTNVDTFRSTVRSRWEALWASFGKK
jgi:hypothetical protein